MRIMTILGTRPEIIRLCEVIKLLDNACDHVLVHTGQNYEDRLNGLFFRELGVRKPDVFMGVRAHSFGEQVAQILQKSEQAFIEHRPDRLLILGDTNSGLSSIVAKRLGIPVYHMEAGNRCYDDRVPEEINRRVIDHSSSVLMPYTERSKENLLREGIESSRVFVTGNPIYEVIRRFLNRIDSSLVLENLGLQPGRFFLVTMHRAENVDNAKRLGELVLSLKRIYSTYGFPVICSLHPRTKARAQSFGICLDEPGLRFIEPFGFLDFVKLEKSAFCILTDSGTVQEEACIFGVPNVTIRDVTERPETIDCGSNVLAGSDPDTIVRLVSLVTAQRCVWNPPNEYLATNVSSTVCRIVVGYRIPDASERAWKKKDA